MTEGHIPQVGEDIVHIFMLCALVSAPRLGEQRHIVLMGPDAVPRPRKVTVCENTRPTNRDRAGRGRHRSDRGHRVFHRNSEPLVRAPKAAAASDHVMRRAS